MKLTVGELKEKLDDYGDHLPVVVIVDEDDDDREITDFEVDAGHSITFGEPSVQIRL